MKIGERPPKIAQELIDAYRDIAPATLGHVPGTRFMSSAIKPAYRDCKLVGPAFTVRAPGLDVSATTEACEMIEAGYVMVVDRGGDTEYACTGEFRALAQQRKGVAGWVIDGASTDILAIQDLKFPTFARSWSAMVGKAANVSGEILTPVSCGNVVVNPGDLIVADDDGIAVISPKEAEELLEHCQEVEKRETEKRREYQLGK